MNSWRWDEKNPPQNIIVSPCQKIVFFNPVYSCGTAAVASNSSLQPGYQHYWEIQYQFPVYGTDMMVGLATLGFNHQRYPQQYKSLLGEDENSWGISYHGYFYHKGVKIDLLKGERYVENRTKNKRIAKLIKENTIVGIHLDSWHGKLSLSVDGMYFGVIARHQKFRCEFLRVIATSTAARTSMKLLYSGSHETTLLYLSTISLHQSLFSDLDEASKKNKHGIQRNSRLKWKEKLKSLPKLNYGPFCDFWVKRAFEYYRHYISVA